MQGEMGRFKIAHAPSSIPVSIVSMAISSLTKMLFQ